jgi:protein-tyrosine-phosphatase
VKTVIFACVHNAGRSQMAAAFFNALADPLKARALSAGTAPGERVYPQVVAVMQEEGIDLSAARPQKLTAELAAEAQLLITMGAGTLVRMSQGYAATTGLWRTRRVSPSSGFARSATTFALAWKPYSCKGTRKALPQSIAPPSAVLRYGERDGNPRLHTRHTTLV